MAEGKSVDDTILRYADSRSPEEISRMLGGMVSPAQVAAHTKRLLTSRTWLDQAEQESLAFLKLKGLLSELEGQFQTLDHTKVQLQLIKAIFERMDKQRLATDEQLSRLYANQAQIMFDAIRLALDVVVRELRADEDEAHAALRKALPEAVLVLTERNVGNEIRE